MLQSNNQGINHLISYYQDLVKLNSKFADININNNETIHYDDLVEQLIAIRQLLINKTFININAVYKPTEKLFINRDHFIILEVTIQFFKQNVDAVYPLPEAEESKAEDKNETHALGDTELYISSIAELQQSIAEIKNYLATDANSILVQACENLCAQIAGIEEKIAVVFNQGNSVDCEKPENSANAEILKNLSDMKESINKLIDDDFGRSIVKSTNDTLAVLNTNYELMKADINKYDTLLTTHITQSSTNATLAIEKEHARFVQKMSSDVNIIVAGITEANIAELATQTTLVQTSVRELDDKSFKRSCIIFILAIGALFACSILSSTWAANKALGEAKVFKVTAVCNGTAPITSQKTKHH